MSHSNPKLEDVAKRAHVSKMTVSLCLREDQGEGRMSPATRDRVLAAVKELNYRPNGRARALRLGRTNVFAFYAGHGFVNVRKPFFTEIVSGLQEGCESVRKDLLLHSTFHSATSEEILSELKDGRIDGLIASMPMDDPLALGLAGGDMPVVAVADELEGIPSVLVDDVGGARMIVDHLHSQGHKRVAYFTARVEPLSGRRRRISFLNRAAELGMQVVVLYHSFETWESGVQMAISCGFTALACWCDDLAYETIALLMKLGIEIPNQIAVTGFDGCPSSIPTTLPLTTISAPWSAVAKSATLLLNSRLTGNEVAQCIVLPVEFIVGATT